MYKSAGSTPRIWRLNALDSNLSAQKLWILKFLFSVSIKLIRNVYHQAIGEICRLRLEFQAVGGLRVCLGSLECFKESRYVSTFNNVSFDIFMHFEVARECLDDLKSLILFDPCTIDGSQLTTLEDIAIALIFGPANWCKCHLLNAGDQTAKRRDSCLVLLTLSMATGEVSLPKSSNKLEPNWWLVNEHSRRSIPFIE